MQALIITLVSAVIITLIQSAVDFIDSMLTNLAGMALYAEQYIDISQNIDIVDLLFEITFEFGIALIVLRFLKKGFGTYVLWTDGDPEIEPVSLLIRFVEAIVLSLSFPTVYGWIAEITEDLTNKFLTELGLISDISLLSWSNNMTTSSLVELIIGLIFIIFYFILHFQFLIRGLEMLILRLGFPLACSGLIDSDRGIYAEYSMILIKTMVTVVIQIALCKLGVGILLNSGTNLNMLWGIACMMTAVKTPQFLNQFMIPSGSNVMGNIQSSVRIASVVKNMVKK